MLFVALSVVEVEVVRGGVDDLREGGCVKGAEECARDAAINNEDAFRGYAAGCVWLRGDTALKGRAGTEGVCGYFHTTGGVEGEL